MSFLAAPAQKLLFKIGVIATPFILLSASYLILDPFQVLHPKSYFYDRYVEPDRDYASTETYLAVSANRVYDSFIFGSSRSLALECSDMKSLLPAESNCFHYDAANETLFGIWGKVRLLDKRDTPLRNIVILLDADVITREDDLKQHLFIKHPLVSGQSAAVFHLVMFRSYFEDLFFIKYMDFSWFKTYRSYMKGAIWHRMLVYDRDSNDEVVQNAKRSEAQLDEYYREHASIFYSRESTDKRAQKPVIDERQMKRLREISEILKRRGVQVKVAIAPLYNQIYFNEQDLRILKELFGEKNVYDYSGVNAMTDNMRNYIETSHFRPIVGRQMLKEMFGQSQSLS